MRNPDRDGFNVTRLTLCASDSMAARFALTEQRIAALEVASVEEEAVVVLVVVGAEADTTLLTEVLFEYRQKKSVR